MGNAASSIKIKKNKSGTLGFIGLVVRGWDIQGGGRDCESMCPRQTFQQPPARAGTSLNYTPTMARFRHNLTDFTSYGLIQIVETNTPITTLLKELRFVERPKQHRQKPFLYEATRACGVGSCRFSTTVRDAKPYGLAWLVRTIGVINNVYTFSRATRCCRW